MAAENKNDSSNKAISPSAQGKEAAYVDSKADSAELSSPNENGQELRPEDFLRKGYELTQRSARLLKIGLSLIFITLLIQVVASVYVYTVAQNVKTEPTAGDTRPTAVVGQELLDEIDLRTSQFREQVEKAKSVVNPPQPKRTLLTDSVRDFSGVQGKNSWFYGFYENAYTNPVFKQFTDFSNDRWWVNRQKCKWSSIGAEGTCPWGGTHLGSPITNVRRWISPVNGQIQVSGMIEDIAKSNRADGYTNGRSMWISVNGAKVWNKILEEGGQKEEYSVRTTVRVGNFVDFAVNPIEHHNSDQCYFTAQIWRIGD